MVTLMKEKIFKDEAGFTLLEVMISIFILSVALLTLSGLMTSTIRNSDYGRRTTEAANLAREKIEEIERTAVRNFDATLLNDVAPGSDPVAGINPDIIEGYGTIAGHTNFKRELYITPTGANFKDIAVRVLWKDGIGPEHNSIFRTYIAR